MMKTRTKTRRTRGANSPLTKKQSELRRQYRLAKIKVDILTAGFAEQMQRGFYNAAEYSDFIELVDEMLAPQIAKLQTINDRLEEKRDAPGKKPNSLQ